MAWASFVFHLRPANLSARILATHSVCQHSISWGDAIRALDAATLAAIWPMRCPTAITCAKTRCRDALAISFLGASPTRPARERYANAITACFWHAAWPIGKAISQGARTIRVQPFGHRHAISIASGLLAMEIPPPPLPP